MAKHNILSDAELRRTVEIYAECGNQVLAANRLRITQGKVSERLAQAAERGIFAEGQASAFPTKVARGPGRGKVKRYILTCAQNWTKLHEPTWLNLMALAEHYDAAVYVSTFSYVKEGFGNTKKAKRVLTEAEASYEYASEVVPYINNDRIDLNPNLTWCGELQISPTARRPLMGFESYTYRKSTIVPHTTVALRSIPAVKGEGVKLLYTTGCVTQMNYIQRRDGFRAEHFHSYGALLVEVTDSGWFCRQLVQGSDGAMHDLNVKAVNGKVRTAVHGRESYVADIMYGDIHATKVDEFVATTSWGAQSNSMLETLRPKTQHLHDLLDFTSRSHHTRKDPHEMYRAHVKTSGDVMHELKATVHVLRDIHREWCKTVVVNSNHDRHLDRYLKEVDWRCDLQNAELILDLNLRMLRAIRTGDTEFYLQEAAARECGAPLDIRFLREDESDVILPDVDGGIEAGIHGDRGANGAKGTVSGIARTSRKVNMADKHAAEICDLVYCGGTSALLDMGFNKGLSSWTHSHVVTYTNGTRAIIGIWRGKWRA